MFSGVQGVCGKTIQCRGVTFGVDVGSAFFVIVEGMGS